MARRTVILAGLSSTLVCCSLFLCCRTENAEGQVNVSGGADLKGSQHYPPLFGRSVAELVVAQKACREAHVLGLACIALSAVALAGSDKEGSGSTEDRMHAF